MSEELEQWKQRAETAEAKLEQTLDQLVEGLKFSEKRPINAISPKQALKERAEAAEAELARHKAKPCEDSCGQCAECALLACDQELQRQAEKAETAERAQAEMREALGKCDAAFSTCLNEMRGLDVVRQRFDNNACSNAQITARKILNSTAGTGYLSPAEVKEQVGPLVRALQEADCNIAHENTCPWTYDKKNPCNCGAHDSECRITDALEHAKAKGWE